MDKFESSVESIFYSIIKNFGFEVSEVESKDSYANLTLQNQHVNIFIGHHMGELNASIKPHSYQVHIQSLLWGLMNKNLKLEDFTPIKHSPNLLMGDLFVYSMVIENAYMSFFCKDLFEGDFSKIDNYIRRENELQKTLFEYSKSFKSFQNT